MARIAPARRVAWALLGDVRRRDARARDLLRTSERMERLAERDRALASRLVLGVVGARGLLDAVLDAHLARGARLEPQVRDALQLACYELLFLSTPPSVAASQGVELVRSCRPRAAGLANAVLRRVAEQDVPVRRDALARVREGASRADDLALASGYPRWLLERVTAQRGGDAARSLALSALAPAPVYVATNVARHTDDETFALLEWAGLGPRPAALPGSFELGIPAGLARSGLVDAADVVVADLSAQRIARMAAPAPSARVLEVGQGRGTKSLLLESVALRAGGAATLVGVDSVGFKVRVAQRRMVRAGLADKVACVELDARGLADKSVPPALRDPFDLVFVDAPCSGTGTLRRHPEIAWSLAEADVCALAELQGAILRAAATRVRPGGALVYATCSLLADENEDVVRDFLAGDAGADFVPDGDPYQALPAPDASDGHYCARLLRH